MEQLKGVLHIILSLVDNVFVGKSLLVKILKGSKSKEILKRNLHSSKSFGALFWLNDYAIELILIQYTHT